MDGTDPNMQNILTKLDLLLEFAVSIAKQIKRLSEVDENTPSSLITHMGDPVAPSLLTTHSDCEPIQMEDPSMKATYNMPSSPLMF